MRRPNAETLVAWLSGLAVVCSLGLILLALVLRETTIDHANHNICVQVEQLKGLQRESIMRDIRSFPKLSYYRDHPRELGAALVSLHRQLHEFQKQDCP